MKKAAPMWEKTMLELFPKKEDRKFFQIVLGLILLVPASTGKHKENGHEY